MKLLEMMASVNKNEKVGTKVIKKLKSALKKLFEQASSVSPDPYSEHKIFFVAPKNAMTSKFDLTGLNFHIQNTMIELKRSSLKFEEVGFDD